jgi:tetratricopeptide (TPR) repeat protein
VIAPLLAALLTVVVPNESRALSARAIELTNEWRLDAALQLAEEAREIAIACGDDGALSRALDAIGIVERSHENAGVALDVTTEALEIAVRIGDRDSAARAWNDLGRIHFDLLGDTHAAKEAYEQAQRLAVDATLLARILNNEANLARGEDHFPEALALYLRVAKMARRHRDDVALAAAEHNIGLIYEQQRDPRPALLHLRRALAIEEKHGHRAAAGRTLLSIAEARLTMGENPIADLRRAERIGRADPQTVATALLREADILTKSHDFSAAAIAAAESARIARQYHDAETIALAQVFDARLQLARRLYREAEALARAATTTHTSLDTAALAWTTTGDAARALGNNDAARAAFQSAVDAIEVRRAGVVGDASSHVRFLESEIYPYHALLELEAGAGDAAAALRIAEMAKARALLDTLHRPAPAAYQSTAIPGTDVTIEFALTARKLFIFTLDSKGVTVRSTEAAPIRRLALQFAELIAARNLGFRPVARELYNRLLGAAPLPSKVLVIPDGILWRVPFAALIDERDRHLIERCTLSYAPSIATLRTGSGERQRGVAIFVNSSVSRSESSAIERLYGAEAHSFTDPTVRTALAVMPKSAILHFATHGVLDEHEPMRSRLLLSPGNALDARTVAALHLQARLAVLSACDTAAGPTAAGEGVIAMSWAFFAAGCPAVIASQWRIESASTTSLMVALHRGVERGGALAPSLRDAQLEVLRMPRFQHPYYWASFILLGQ